MLDDYDGPTCLVEDFNAVLGPAEKRGGAVTLSQPNRAFRNWVRRTCLIDLGHQGPAYIWCNNQGGHANVA